ncbi:uncharacterized protein B0P05DRAFT_473290 [Gilbertella persicaria]|uniref:uncharacterized protein n=1 Tax=Gilbertella persicaria TaxID=101096 RepID=UPI0022203CA6|nr:uncharacterized protein B0P05DRAFT_473290 [Gilbertella persicaria]KAI8074347.1 hypothetical protein B0P05DRAFT_473290 [Gilbertella persicaria]
MVNDNSDDNVINITKDGQVTKRILREGPGKKPEKNNTVSVHYESILYDTNTLFDSSRERKAEFNFNLNSGKVVKAWELVIPTMKVGEKAEIICTSDYGYGDEGRTYIVPPKAKLKFHVELLGFWEVAGSAAERIRSAEKKKLEGNDLFKQGAVNEALTAYRKARDYIKDLWNCEPEEAEECRILIAAINLNIGACYLKLKNYDFAIEVCIESLNRDPTNVKAHYRIATAYLGKGEYDQGLTFVNLGLQVSKKIKTHTYRLFFPVKAK